jgi:uncharacterized protein YheU (UPF0270 family)
MAISMIIPHRELSAEALQGLIEEFATRDGTDYGEREISLTSKVARIRQLLDAGQVMIVFEPQDGSINIVGKEQAGDVAG